MQYNLLTLALFIASASADNTNPINPAAPISTTVWNAGTAATISWSNTGSSSDFQSCDINLGTGNGNVITPVATIASSLPWWNTTSYTYTPPGTLPYSGKVYALTFACSTSSGSIQYSYSTWFKIVVPNGKVQADSSPAGTTTATTSSTDDNPTSTTSAATPSTTSSSGGNISVLKNSATQLELTLAFAFAIIAMIV